MTDKELIAALRLQRIPWVGDVTAKRLINHCGSPSAVFDDKKQALSRIEGVGDYILRGLRNRKYLEEAHVEYDFIKKRHLRSIFYTDPEYPELLRHCLDGPILLFARGHISLNDKKIISIVGTREMTTYGRSFCEQFIEEIAPLDPVIVSGFALGVDICAQKTALDHGLQTIACLAHGLNKIYPSVHKRFVKPVMENGGFFTEFWSSSRPERENFLKRNRIIAGMSQATIVVESAEKGGSLVTADMANGYNRDVFSLPGRAGDIFSVGCNNLIKQHKAHLITSAADLVYLLNWEMDSKRAKPVQRRLFEELEGIQKVIYEYLQVAGRQALDAISIECELPVFKTSSVLLELEMKGVVRSLPGKLFEIV